MLRTVCRRFSRTRRVRLARRKTTLRTWPKALDLGNAARWTCRSWVFRLRMAGTLHPRREVTVPCMVSASTYLWGICRLRRTRPFLSIFLSFSRRRSKKIKIDWGLDHVHGYLAANSYVWCHTALQSSSIWHRARHRHGVVLPRRSEEAPAPHAKWANFPLMPRLWIAARRGCQDFPASLPVPYTNRAP